MNAKKQKNNQESGIALIAVLCMILMVSILVASAVAMSQYAAFESSTFTGFTRSFYIAEGAASRIRWLLLSDRRKHPKRNLESLEEELDDSERYLANNVIHNLDYYGCKISFQIEDMMSGIDISSSSPDSNLRNLFKQDATQQIDPEFLKFCSRLHDYADRNDLLSINGMEKSGYQKNELYNLPRNNKLQFVQEIMYMPGFDEYFAPDKYGRVSMFRIITPEKLKKARGRPSLFSSPIELIKSKCKLSDREMEQVTEALKKWQTDNAPLTNTLEPGLKSKLLTHFSTMESGYYTLVINTSSKSNPGTTLICSFHHNSSAKTNFQYHQFTFY
jgi:hypothetical protein